jgi:hypothetical protein
LHNSDPPIFCADRLNKDLFICLALQSPSVRTDQMKAADVGSMAMNVLTPTVSGLAKVDIIATIEEEPVPDQPQMSVAR